MLVTLLSHLLVRGYVETPFYSCQTRKTHMSHWGSFGQELQLSGWTRWSFFAKYLAPNFELFQAADEVALLVGKGFHISREMHFQDKREKNGCQTLFLSRLTLMPHPGGMILRKILLSPSGDLGIRLVWHNLSPPDRTGPHFDPTVEILFKLN